MFRRVSDVHGVEKRERQRNDDDVPVPASQAIGRLVRDAACSPSQAKLISYTSVLIPKCSSSNLPFRVPF
jgi:hypothetical protein